jgi:hypothetical protein
VGLVRFMDATHVEWRVCEVSVSRCDLLRDREAARVREGTARVSRRVLPGLEGGWLSFENGREKRRLVRYPEDWRHFASDELARLCAEAVVVAPPGVARERGGTTAETPARP